MVETIEAALWAFYHSEDFREGALLAANLGHALPLEPREAQP